MNLKINEMLQKLFFIILLLFNLFQPSISSTTFNRIFHLNDSNNWDISNVLTFENNTLVILNGSPTFPQLQVKVNVLRNDGNLTSFVLKCPTDPKCDFELEQASPLNGYLFIPYFEYLQNTAWCGMVLNLDGSFVNKRIVFDTRDHDKIIINDNSILSIEDGSELFTYTYFNILNIEEGITNRLSGNRSLNVNVNLISYDVVYTSFGEYTIVYYNDGGLYFSNLKPNSTIQDVKIKQLTYHGGIDLPSEPNINCKLDQINSTICNCLVNMGNSLWWSIFNYTNLIPKQERLFFKLDLSLGYQTLVITPLTYKSGFLILGYADNLEIQRFTTFILNETNFIQQAYLPSIDYEQERSLWLNIFNNFDKINAYYQEFFIPTDVYPVFNSYVDKNHPSYYFNLLPNNILISGHREGNVWSADLTQLLIKADNITQRMILNITSDLPPNVVLVPSNNSPIQIHTKFINITFNRPIYLQQSNITLYQINNSKKILRQIFEIDSKLINIDNDENTVTLTFIESVFNIPGATYSLEIDDQFFRYRTGINGSVFSEKLSIYYNTENQEFEFAGKATVLLRLTEDGTNLFEMSDKSLFLNNLAEGLAENIPLNDYSQIKFNNYEFDKNINKRQLLLSLLINPPVYKDNNINVEQIKDSLDMMIKNFEETPLSLNNYTKYLDSSYGCTLKNDLWDRYKYILIGIACAGIILTALFLLARKKCKEGNNLIIFKLALLTSDMVSDFLFVIENSGNVEFLRTPSIVFLVLPIVTNLILVFYIFITECVENKKYFIWLKGNSQPAAIVTILCGGDIAALKLLSSNLAGFELFNAPFSKKAENFIYYGGILNTFVEDVPQLIIQIIYQFKTISYDIIPLISLTTGSIILLSTVLGHTYDIIIRVYTKMKGDDHVNKSLIDNIDYEECEECGEHANCKHIIICEKCETNLRN
ncbi:hypothetical protein C1645_876388 [Glomus cerebriforme]|uniref:SbsA Ig-like domain-containing protein n=1 Tax=Glomus cerebriforme TaxID=658196 RepID=A0A397SY95_9GLOM|nr:hypothetical protein C1645_876388 [Glomus cerebriforme]